MTARLIVFDKKGNKVAHSLSLHHKPGTAGELRLAMATSTEVFPEWLFFFLRDLAQRVLECHQSSGADDLTVACVGERAFDIGDRAAREILCRSHVQARELQLGEIGIVGVGFATLAHAREQHNRRGDPSIGRRLIR